MEQQEEKNQIRNQICMVGIESLLREREYGNHRKVKERNINV